MRLISFVIFLLLPLAATAQTGLERALALTLVVRSADAEERFLGSAFFYGDGRVLTNAHVVGQARTVLLEGPDGRVIPGAVIAVDESRDLALVQATSPEGLTPGPQPVLGQRVYAIGAPMEAGFTLTDGIVSHPGRQVDPQQPVLYLQHSAPVNPGSSGGPLVDAEGRLMGINTRIADGSRFFFGIAYAVPLADIAAFLAEAEAQAIPAPPALGLHLRALGPKIRAALGYAAGGVLVDHVEAGKLAGAAGMAPGDILVSLGGLPVTRPGDVALALAQVQRGAAPAEVTLWRDGRAKTLPLDLGRAAETPVSPMAPAEVARKESYTLREMGLVLDAAGVIDLPEAAEEATAFFAGLRSGDRVLRIDGAPLTPPVLAEAQARAFRAPVLLLVKLSDGSTRHYLLDPWDAGGLRPSSHANVLDQDIVIFD
ncbi:S1C family serine protease [Mesobacterium pallidum]|uniref:S1C family serine protease n=1 Tax=Mesobacterium pallidum TaxID=2872037 RepID=UPI001EE314F8|nr:trypsin-like peptidase domain-containing protein [Mesobacterium pallidum]